MMEVGQRLFGVFVRWTGSQTSAVLLILGFAIGFFLIAGSILNPEKRSVRWLKGLGISALVLAIFGSWGVKDPELLQVRAAAAQVPVLESETKTLRAQIETLTATNLSLVERQKLLENQVGQEKSKSAEALSALQTQLKALADSFGDFDRTKDGIERLTLPGDLLFDSDKAQLGCEQKESLSKLLGYLFLEAKLPFKDKLKQIVVIGNTDNTPVSRPDRVEHNKRLSEARANAVADYLVSHGVLIPVTRIGRGMMSPIGSQAGGETLSLNKIDELNSDANKKRANRRVELLLIHPQDKVPTN